MYKVISLIAARYKLAPEVIEAARMILAKPKAMLAVIREVPPLPKETLNDPDVIYAYPAAFIQWSMCMHGLTEWDTVPVLSYADYIARLETAFLPTDIAITRS